MTPDDMLAFEEDIAAEFEAAKIAAPVHLAGGNEQNLIDIFQHIAEDDWICCSWRSHYHALLKGVPPAELKQAIMDGRSIALCFPEHKMISSAIVGGICPIAMGIAWAIKRKYRDPRLMPKVWCFIGDMTSTSGIFAEVARYAMQHALPIMFIIEDNGMSVCTPTREVWGTEGPTPVIGGYGYQLTRPHVGINKFVRF